VTIYLTRKGVLSENIVCVIEIVHQYLRLLRGSMSHIQTHKQTRTQTHTHTQTHKDIHSDTHKQTHTQAQAQTQTQTHSQTHTPASLGVGAYWKQAFQEKAILSSTKFRFKAIESPIRYVSSVSRNMQVSLLLYGNGLNVELSDITFLDGVCVCVCVCVCDCV